MFRSTGRCLIYKGKHPMGMVGYHLEDHKHEYDTTIYYPAKHLKAWYARYEIHHAKTWLREMQETESVNKQNGLHYNGDGAFEREMKRRGVEPEKYTLATTTATKRVNEMVILRRSKLEEMAAEKMSEQRNALKSARPSEWYDEAKGPLNPHFLHLVQPSYADVITELREQPIRLNSRQIERRRQIDADNQEIAAV